LLNFKFGVSGLGKHFTYSTAQFTSSEVLPWFLMLIHEAFNETLKRYKISGRALAQEAQASESLVSQFRHGKKGVTDDMLDSLLEAMQQLAPGSRKYFCSLLAGEPIRLSVSEGEFKDISEDEIPELLIAIARRWRAGDKEVVQVS
jgi:transcriptional regulator with XRE-family HTH domain